MSPEVQFSLRVVAGCGLRSPGVCLQWLPEWLPRILLAELTSEPSTY